MTIDLDDLLRAWGRDEVAQVLAAKEDPAEPDYVLLPRKLRRRMARTLPRTRWRGGARRVSPIMAKEVLRALYRDLLAEAVRRGMRSPIAAPKEEERPQ